jgi:hypothetical protein
MTNIDMDDWDDWTVDDLRAHADTGDIGQETADYLIAHLQRTGCRTLAEFQGYATGIIAEWAAAQPGGVEIGGRIVKPAQVVGALTDELNTMLDGNDGDD